MENPTTKPRCGRRRHVRFAGLSQGPETLCEFIMSRGGLRRDQLNIGDFLAMDADRLLQARPGICKLIRKAPGQGMYVDHAREVAEEAGYLPEGSDINDLIDAVDSELRGKPVFASGDIDSLPLPPDAEAPETPAVKRGRGRPPKPGGAADCRLDFKIRDADAELLRTWAGLAGLPLRTFARRCFQAGLAQLGGEGF